MIIKIDIAKLEEPNSEIDDIKKCSWVYYGEFKKIRTICLTYKEVFADLKGPVSKAGSVWVSTSKDLDIITIIVGTFTTSDRDEEYVITTDRPTYLLNNNGKTVEKLVY